MWPCKWESTENSRRWPKTINGFSRGQLASVGSDMWGWVQGCSVFTSLAKTDTDVFSGHAGGQITESLCSLGSLGRSVCMGWVFALTALPGLATEVPGEHFCEAQLSHPEIKWLFKTYVICVLVIWAWVLFFSCLYLLLDACYISIMVV